MGYINIAIDGPAGSGKSTIAKSLAKALGILHLDTGAMYRALALKAIRLGIDPNDRDGVIGLLDNTDITVEYADGMQHTYLDGEDVSGLIRTPVISKGASDISAIPEVRIKLVELQRNVAQSCDVVMDGRDIGSYIMPESKNKFYITATVEERARRRLAELNAKGDYLDVSAEEMQQEVAQRDHNDSTRAYAPLTKLDDAILIDTTEMDIETAVNTVNRLLKL